MAETASYPPAAANTRGPSPAAQVPAAAGGRHGARPSCGERTPTRSARGKAQPIGRRRGRYPERLRAAGPARTPSPAETVRRCGLPILAVEGPADPVLNLL